MTRESWQALGRVLPQDLGEARLLCHWAVQILVAAADATLGSRAGDGDLKWLAHHGALVGPVIDAGDQALRVGLRVADLSLLVLSALRSGDASDRILAQVPLDGGQMPAALAWVSTRIAEITGAAPARPLALRNHDMPDHPAGRGQAFVIGSEGPALEELARWAHNASVALNQIRADTPRASAVVCRPHEFEINTRIRPDRGSEHVISVGLSPGDDDHAEPYWYVRPRPDISALPPLDDSMGGMWTGSGAVLLGSELIGDGSAYAQESRTLGFLRSAMNISRGLLRR